MVRAVQGYDIAQTLSQAFIEHKPKSSRQSRPCNQTTDTAIAESMAACICLILNVLAMCRREYWSETGAPKDHFDHLALEHAISDRTTRTNNPSRDNTTSSRA